VGNGDRIGIAAREAAGAAVGPGQDRADLVDQRIAGNGETLVEESQGDTDEQAKDGGKKSSFKDDVHRGLT